jgi:hypothetical protein
MLPRSKVWRAVLAVACVLAAVGALLVWLSGSKLDVLALGALAFALVLLCILGNADGRRRGAE